MADNFKRIHTGFNFKPQSGAPSNPIDGDVYYDLSLNKLRARQNGVWVNLSDSDGTVLLADGSTASPSLAFINQTDLGFHRDALGSITLGANTGSLSRLVIRAEALNASALLTLNSNGGGTGDQLVSFAEASSSTGAWSIGRDDSDSSAFKISQNINALGTNDFFKISTAGLLTLGATASTLEHIINGDLRVTSTQAGAQAEIIAVNTSAAAASHASLRVTTSGTGSSAAYLELRDGASANSWNIVNNVSNQDLEFRTNGTAIDPLGGTVRGSISDAGLWTLGQSGSTQIHQINGELLVQTSQNDVHSLSINNTNTGSSALSGLSVQTASGAANGADPFIRLIPQEGTPWYIFSNTADSDTLWITNSSTRTNVAGNFGKITTAGLWTLGHTGSSNGHVVNGYFRLNFNSLNEGYVQTTGNDGFLSLAGGAGSTNGRNIIMYAGSHATNPDLFQIRQDSVVDFSIAQSGLITLGQTGGSQTHSILGNATMTFPTAGSRAVFQIAHADGANSASHAALQLTSAGASGGDPYIQFLINAVQNWSAGVDNSDSDKFKISASNFVGTNDYLTLTTGGLVTIGASGGTQIHQVNGSLQSTGNVGLGGNLSSAHILRVGQANPLTGADQLGIKSELTGTSAATSQIGAIVGSATTAAAVFNTTLLYQFSAENPTMGAGSTATRRIAYLGTNPTGGTNNAFLADNTSFVGNYFIHSTSTNQSLFMGQMSIGASSFGTTALLNVGGENTLPASLSNTNQIAIQTNIIGTSVGTSSVRGIQAFVTSGPSTVVAETTALRAGSTTLGSAGTITRNLGLRLDSQTVGTNNSRIADNISFTGNWFLNSTDSNPSAFSGAMDWAQIATPSNPVAGRNRIYFKNDGNLYKLDSSGTELVFATGAGSGDINNGGNSFGANITIGTNDAFALNLETNNVARMTLSSGGDLSLFRDEAAGVVGMTIENTNTTVGLTRADLLLKVDDNSTGSSRIRMQVGPLSGQYATIGKDAGDSDAFKIVGAGNGFSGEQFRVDTTGNDVRIAGGGSLQALTIGLVSSTVTHIVNGSIQLRRQLGILSNPNSLSLALVGGAVNQTIFAGTTQEGLRAHFRSNSAATGRTLGLVALYETEAASYTSGVGAAIRIQTPTIGAGSTVTRNVGLLFQAAATEGTNNANIADNEAFSGNWFLNSTNANPSFIAGRVGLGQSAGVGTGLYIGHASALSGTGQFGVDVAITGQSSATSSITGVRSQATTTAAAFSVSNLWHFYANNTTKGAGSTITRYAMYGGAIPTQGTNNAFLTDATNFAAGNWGIYLSTSNPSLLAGPLQLPNGTAALPALTFSGDPDTGIYSFGTNTIGIAANGTYVTRFGESSGSGFQVFNLAAAGLTSISMSASSGTFVVTAGTGSSAGGQVRFYGNTHATKADYLEFNAGTTIHGYKDGNGAWTLGESGGIQTHTIRGARLDINGSSGGFNQIVSDPGADSVFQIRLNNGTSSLNLRGGTGAASKGISIYGGSHATKASVLEFINGVGGIEGSINSSGAFTLGASAGVQTHTINGNAFLSFPTAGSRAQLNISHADSANAASHATLQLTTAGASAGDPYIQFLINAVQNWSVGVDNSDSDSFKISASNFVGTNDYFKVTTGGKLTMAAGTGDQAGLTGLVYSDVTERTNVGAGEDDLGTYVMPANTMTQNGDHLELEWQGTTAANANNKNIRVYLGTASVDLTTGAVALNNRAWRIRAQLKRTASGIIKGYVEWFNDDNATSPFQVKYVERVVDYTTALTFKITGEATADGDINNRTTSAWFNHANP